MTEAGNDLAHPKGNGSTFKTSRKKSSGVGLSILIPPSSLRTYLLSKSPQKNSVNPRRKIRKSLGSNPEINKIFLLNKGNKQFKALQNERQCWHHWSANKCKQPT